MERLNKIENNMNKIQKYQWKDKTKYIIEKLIYDM